VTSLSPDERAKIRHAYFEMLAEMGVTKHLGALHATKALVEMCRIGSRSLVLDVGCGTGMTACYLARVYGCKVIGVDVVPRMAQRANAEARRRGVADRVHFVTGDAQALPFASNQFDAVITESVNVFLDHPLLALQEYAQVVAPGGYVGITESLWDSGSEDEVNTLLSSLGAVPYRLDDWRALMAKAGLTEIVGEEYQVEMSREARGRIRRYGCLGLLRTTAGAAWALISNRKVRSVLQRTMKGGSPVQVIKAARYGMLAGRKEES